MNLTLSDDEAGELRSLLDTVLGDLSHEIAATDNADYRATLRQRRELVTSIRHALDVPSTTR